MHHIYHTKGFILSSRNINEANKIFAIYTKELGLVRATAQGIRLNKSKLRFSLQDLFYANIDLVQGRDMWRVTSAESISSFPMARRDKESIEMITRVSRLLGRLCPGENPNEKIFDSLIQAFTLLDETSINKETREALEIHLVLNIMHSLGYIGDSKLLSHFLVSSFNKKLTNNLLKEKKSIVAHINKAIIESQL